MGKDRAGMGGGEERYRGPTYRPTDRRRAPGTGVGVYNVRNLPVRRRRHPQFFAATDGAGGEAGEGTIIPSVRAVVLPKGPSPLLCSRTGSCHHRHHVRTHSAEMVYRVRATKFLEMPSC